MINHPPRIPIPLGATVSHPLDQVCWLCTTCAECGHSVEDGVHAAGCDECACPLHLHPEEDQLSGDAREALVPTRFVAMVGGTEVVIESSPDYTHFGARYWTVTNRGNGDQVGRSNGKDGDLFWWRPRAMDGGTSFDTPEEALAAARSAY